MNATITIKDLTDLKDAIVSELHAEFRVTFQSEIGNLRKELKQDNADLRKELKQDNADLRTELKQDIVDLRVELKQDNADLRTELKQDIYDLRTELKQDIVDLREEMRAGFAGVGDAIESVLSLVDKNYQFQMHQAHQIVAIDRRVVILESYQGRYQQT